MFCGFRVFVAQVFPVVHRKIQTEKPYLGVRTMAFLYMFPSTCPLIYKAWLHMIPIYRGLSHYIDFKKKTDKNIDFPAARKSPCDIVGSCWFY
jgi:hypothetical protein